MLPHLERIRSEFDIEFLADIKPNLSKQQIYALANSGFVAVQLGIESLSDQLLIRMRKGNRALQHLQTLKWFNEAGIAVHYNILTHIPGETAEDYREALAYARHIQHINPPSGVFPIELNRYAPLFENWSAYGFQRPVPSPFYEAILDRDRIDLQRFSYAFVGHHPATREASVTKAREEFMGFVETKWIPEYPLENFFYWVGPGRVFLAREGSRPLHTVLERNAARLFLSCDQIQSVEKLIERFGDGAPGSALRDIDRMIDDGILVRSTDGTHVLATAVRRMTLRPSFKNALEQASAASSRSERV